MSVSNRVVEYLKTLPILTIVDRQVMLKELNLVDKDRARASAVSALEYYSANTGVSNRDDGRGRPARYFAIKMLLPYAVGVPPASVYLSLTGIPRQLLSDASATDSNRIIERLQAKYGIETIKYWCASAQYRSVVLAQRGMSSAKLRDGTCRLCCAADLICQIRGVPSEWATPRRITACHMVSRRIVFWNTLSAIDDEFQNIFTDKATIAFTRRMKENKWHSDSRYIVALCHEHDALLQDVLTDAAT